MWILDALTGRLACWRKIVDQRLANQQGDLLRIEQKLDDADFRLHRTLGEQSGRLDDQSITIGGLARDINREAKHLDMAARVGEPTVTAAKELRARIEDLEQRADKAERQIATLRNWGKRIDEWLSAQCEPPKEPMT